MVCTVVSVRAQDPWEHFGDKHVGGDVPIDEAMAPKKRSRSGSSQLSEDRVLKRGPLAVSKADRAAFASFLRSADTGMVRLLPPSAVYRAYLHGRPITRRDQYVYSFANLTHSMVNGSDIQLNENKLSTGSGLGYGMMVNLGDVPLEQIDLFDSRTRFLADYKRPVTILFARDEASRFQNSVIANDGLHYQNSLPVEIGSTYLLRSINYGRPLSIPIKSDESKWGAHSTDVLVAFRVVRKDTDGGVTIAWKLLKKYSTPKLFGSG
jgi:hypothetical protein